MFCLFWSNGFWEYFEISPYFHCSLLSPLWKGLNNFDSPLSKDALWHAHLKSALWIWISCWKMCKVYRQMNRQIGDQNSSIGIELTKRCISNFVQGQKLNSPPFKVHRYHHHRQSISSLSCYHCPVLTFRTIQVPQLMGDN